MRGKILVTGAYGFVGGAVRQELARKGLENTIFASRRKHPNAAAVVLDLCDVSTYSAVDWASITQVIHLASTVPAHGKDFSANVRGTQLLMSALQSAPIETFILVSSCSVYGGEDEVRMDEVSAVYSRDEYGQSKRAQEEVVVSQMESAKVVVLRPSSIYGQGMARTLLSVMVERFTQGLPMALHAPLNYVQNFVHVADVAELIVSCLVAGVSGTYNVFSDSTVNMDELVEEVRLATSSTSEIDDKREGLGPRITFANSEIHRCFPEFEFKTLSDGLRLIVDG